VIRVFEVPFTYRTFKEKQIDNMSDNRKLAAIMFTDIEGYTALMQKDEARAVLLREHHRKGFQRTHEKYHGQVLQYYGDGTLSIFESSVQAVNCAIALQQEMLILPQVPLRIGIHIGDIIRTEEEIIGDAVNLTSRIETLAIPGSVCISKQVQQQIKNHGIQTKNLGVFQFKNIEHPVEVFAIDAEGLIIPSVKQIAKKNKPIDHIKRYYAVRVKYLAIIILAVLLIAYIFNTNPFKGIYHAHTNDSLSTSNTETIDAQINDNSIAVLPFANMSNDPEQEYFSDGMMDEILNHLYKIGGLQIPSRTSSMRYKGISDKTIQEMGKELGVAHVLEGSVRKSGNTVRIIVQLINVQKDTHLWSEDYEAELEDVFAIQSNIAQQVAFELKTHINPDVKERIEVTPTENPEAYNLFLLARYHLVQTMEHEKAIALLNNAISLDSTFAEAYALQGYYWLLKGSWSGDMKPDELLSKALPLLNKAMELNKDYPMTYAYLSQLHLWYNWDFDAARKNWDTFFQLCPSNTSVISNYYDFLNASGRSQEAAEIADRAVLNDPSYSTWGSGLSYYFDNQPTKAVQHYEIGMKLFPSVGKTNGLARFYIYTEKYHEVVNLLEEYVGTENQFPRTSGNLGIAYYHTGQQTKCDFMIADLKKLSENSPVGSPAFYTAMIYAQMSQIDLAFEWLEKAYEDREVEMYWMNVEPPFTPLYGDPRWPEMLGKVGF